MSILARVKARYEADRHSARAQAVKILQPHLPEFNLSGWGARAKEAYLDQWLGDPKCNWDWEEIFRRHGDPDRLDIAIWGANDRLCGLALGTTTSEAVEIRFLEGDPNRSCACELIGGMSSQSVSTVSPGSSSKNRLRWSRFVFESGKYTRPSASIFFIVSRETAHPFSGGG